MIDNNINSFIYHSSGTEALPERLFNQTESECKFKSKEEFVTPF